MKILVVGGIHGDEPLGQEIVAALHAKPIPNVDVLCANPLACDRSVRFIDDDLNRVFPGALGSDRHEVALAYELRAQLDADFDLILDFHNTHTPGVSCGFIGDRGNRRLPAEAASFLGLGQLVIADYDCINRFVPNCLSVEVSMSSSECRSDLWISRIRGLASAEANQLGNLTLPSIWQFVGAIPGDAAMDLPGIAGWRPFRPLPSRDAAALGLPTDAHALFVHDRFTPWNLGSIVVPASLASLSPMSQDMVGTVQA